MRLSSTVYKLVALLMLLLSMHLQARTFFWTYLMHRDFFPANATRHDYVFIVSLQFTLTFANLPTKDKYFLSIYYYGIFWTKSVIWLPSITFAAFSVNNSKDGIYEYMTTTSRGTLRYLHRDSNS